MTDRLMIGTRKGLFILERGKSGKSALGGGWRIVRTAFIGDPISMVLADSRDGALYAALSLGHFGSKLHRSTDEGATWEEVAAPVYPAGAAIAGRQWEPDKPPPQDPASLELIWSLEAGGKDEPGVLWAGTIPGGLFRSKDRGAHWELNAALWAEPTRKEWSGGGYDHAGIHSVSVQADNPRHLTVGVSTGGVWISEDGGTSWVVRAKGMRAGYLPPEQAEVQHMQDVHRLAQNPRDPHEMWVQHHSGMYHSKDGGAHWEELQAKPSTFGFAVEAHPRQPGTAWFVPAIADQCRVPVDGKMVVTRTQDGGRTFETLHEGLPQEHAYHLIYRHGLAVDSEGRRLVMGSTTGGLWSSTDSGESWATVTTGLPPIFCVRNYT